MLDFSEIQRYDFARDMFLFSFYTRGMSFVDMAFLKKKDLKNGILSYKRQKSGQQLFIHWENCMQHIVDKYDTDNSPYLLYFQDRSAILASPPSPSERSGEGEGGDA